MLLWHSRKELTWGIESPSKKPRFLQTVTNQETRFPLPETNRLYLSPSSDCFKKLLAQTTVFPLKTGFKIEIRWETAIDSISQPHLPSGGSTEAHGFQWQ